MRSRTFGMLSKLPCCKGAVTKHFEFLDRESIQRKVNRLRSFQMFHNPTSEAQEKGRPYEDAVNALNGLQSNAAAIAQVIKERDKQRYLNIPNAIHFGERVGTSLSDIDGLSVIHVSGTKGKGSTCAYTESILRHHGYKTGFYSSPHLIEVRERIRINGAPLSKENFSRYFWQVFDRLLQTKAENDGSMPGYFQFLTIMAFHVFKQEKVDVAILEVGIGGQYDCTNVVRYPVVCGVTSLGIDHSCLLGKTIDKIAWHKAGIFKPHVPAVTVNQPPEAMAVLRQRSIEIECPLYCAPLLQESASVFAKQSWRLPASFCIKNKSLALQLAHIWMHNHDKAFDQRKWLKQHADINLTTDVPVLGNHITITKEIQNGFNNCRWPGRAQIIKRKGITYYMDGAHTVESIQLCSDWFDSAATQELEHCQSPKAIRVLMFNLTGHRNAENLLSILKKNRFYLAVFVPNVAYDHDNIADQTNYKVTMDNQMATCRYHQELWTQQSVAKPMPDTSSATVSKPPQQGNLHSNLKQYQINGTKGNFCNGLLIKTVEEPQSEIFPNILSAFQWLQNTGGSLAVPSSSGPPVPTVLREATCIQLLITGSLYLVGGALTILDPESLAN